MITLDNIREKQRYESVIHRVRVSGKNLYRLLNPLTIRLSDGEVITIPIGFEWDLSSVPKWLWGWFPPDGDFELAALIHDFLYITGLRSQRRADIEMFIWSKAVAGTTGRNEWSDIDNWIRYAIVRIFGFTKYNVKMGKLQDSLIKQIAENNGLTFAQLKAFIEVESGGVGFDRKNGKILIQFEPHWFRRKEPFAPSGAWSVNKVDVQSKEWIAFNSAFKISPDSAMESTSIGLPQIMGFHWKRLGYSSVGDMWDDFKRGEYQQVLALVRFIKTDAKLYKALQSQDWHTVASIYNGSAYKEMAKKWGREPYDISLRKAHDKYSRNI